MKRTIEINDTLPEIIASCIEDTKTLLMDYLKDTPDTDETPCLNNDLDYSGSFHEIVDGSIPVYTSEINDIFFLHGNDCERAFDDAGIGEKQDGEGWPNGWKAAAIYCYVEAEVSHWYQENAESIFEAWKAAQPKEEV